MSIFPDDKNRKPDDQVGARRSAEPAPNAPDAFKGGAIRDEKKIRLNENLLLNTKPNKRKISLLAVMLTGFGALIICGPLFLFVIGPMLGIFNPFGEDTREVPGNPAAFDPIANYAEIALYAQGEAPDIEFIEMTAYYVKRDGTLDLTATSYMPRVTWEFTVAADRPENAPPVGAGGSLDDRYFQNITINAFQPGQLRTVTRTSGGSSESYTYKHLGMEREVSDATIYREAASPPPTCSFKTLWDEAIAREAPADAVALIFYKNREYSFSIQGTGVNLRFNEDCQPIR